LLGLPDTPAAVAAGLGHPLVQVQAAGNRPELLRALRRLETVSRAEVFGTWVHVTGRESDSPEAGAHLLETVQTALEGGGFQNVLIEIIAPGVEDVFMAMMSDPDASERAA